MSFLMLKIIAPIFYPLNLHLKREMCLVHFCPSGKRQMFFQFKENEMILLRDYHGISLHPEWSKILEKFISDKHLKHFGENNLIHTSRYADSSPTEQFPDDTSLTDTSPTDISPNGQFLDRTLPQRTLSRLDISPNGHFPDQTFPWPHVLVRFFFSNHFLFVCTRIY